MPQKTKAIRNLDYRKSKVGLDGDGESDVWKELRFRNGIGPFAHKLASEGWGLTSIEQVKGQREKEDAECIVANVVPLDGRSVLQVLQKLNAKAKQKGSHSRKQRDTAGAPKAACSEKCQRTESHEMNDAMGYAEMYVSGSFRL